MPTQGLYQAPQRRRRLLADDDEGGQPFIGVACQMAADVLHTFLEEETSPPDELELHFSEGLGGLLPAVARRLRQPAQLLHLVSGAEEKELQVIGSALGCGRENDLTREARRLRSRDRNLTEPRRRHVHDGAVGSPAKGDEEPPLEWGSGPAKPNGERTLDLRDDVRARPHEADAGGEGATGAPGERRVALLQNHGDVARGFDRAHETRPGPGMCMPGLDDGIEADVDRTRHLGGARSPQIVDQLGRDGWLNRRDPREPSSAAPVEPSEEMGSEKAGGEGGGDEEPRRDLDCGLARHGVRFVCLHAVIRLRRHVPRWRL